MALENKKFFQAPVGPVPTFLSKLVALLNDSENHDHIDWNADGTSFIVKDQSMFSKVVLPKYFKHSNFASFVRQLNMYGFRKITNINHGGMKFHSDGFEFKHYLFVRGQEFLLEHIKRKVNKTEDLSKMSSQQVVKVLDDLHKLKDSQDDITGSLKELRDENEDLWREVISLRQKHVQQQKVINKVIQFLISLVQQHNMGGATRKRKTPLMIGDRDSMLPYKYQKTQQLIAPDNSKTGPTISEISPVAASLYDVEGLENLPETYEAVEDPMISIPANNNNDVPNKLNEPISVHITTDDISDSEQPIDVDSYLNQLLPHMQSPTPHVIVSPKKQQDHKNIESPKSSNVSDNQEFTEIFEADVPNLTDHEAVETQKQKPTSLNLTTNGTNQKQIAQYTGPMSPSMFLAKPDVLEQKIDDVQGNLNSIQGILNSPVGMNLDFSMLQDLFNPSTDLSDMDLQFPDNIEDEQSTSGSLALIPTNKNSENNLDELTSLL